MRRVLSVLMKHYHVGNGKAVSLKIFGVVDIETGVNIFKGSFRRKGRGIDKLIVRPVNHISRRLQAVVWLKAEIPCFVPALYLVNGKGVFVLSGGLRRFLCLCVKLLYVALGQLAAFELPHKLAAFLRRSRIKHVAHFRPPVLLCHIGLQEVAVIPAVAVRVPAYSVNRFRGKGFFRGCARFFLCAGFSRCGCFRLRLLFSGCICL